MLASHGSAALTQFSQAFPELTVATYGSEFDHEAAIDDADVVLVHEWTDPSLIARLGHYRRRGGRFSLLFHDTHHRAVSDTAAMADLALHDYDAVLAFGEVLRQRYLRLGWGRQVFTWHEAADTRLFRPGAAATKTADLVWIGNWGDDEREQELSEFLIEPSRRLRLSGTVRGVRYPEAALAALQSTSLRYGGWIANVEVPALFALHRMTTHVPRRPYAAFYCRQRFTLNVTRADMARTGWSPSVRLFEAAACGTPIISDRWPGLDALLPNDEAVMIADGGDEVVSVLRGMNDPLRLRLRETALKIVLADHTSIARARELEQHLSTCIDHLRVPGLRNRACI